MMASYIIEVVERTYGNEQYEGCPKCPIYGSAAGIVKVTIGFIFICLADPTRRSREFEVAGLLFFFCGLTSLVYFLIILIFAEKKYTRHLIRLNAPGVVDHLMRLPELPVLVEGVRLPPISNSEAVESSESESKVTESRIESENPSGENTESLLPSETVTIEKDDETTISQRTERSENLKTLHMSGAGSPESLESVSEKNAPFSHAVEPEKAGASTSN